MRCVRLVHTLAGLWIFLKNPTVRTERGVSQSVEVALLVAAAATVAGLIVLAVTRFVTSRMNGLG